MRESTMVEQMFLLTDPWRQPGSATREREKDGGENLLALEGRLVGGNPGDCHEQVGGEGVR